jgi:hypothetical protein
MRTILIVDKDLGFVFWLGQALDKAGYQALPAKNIADAEALLGELKVDIDLVIASLASPEARVFAQTLHSQQGHLRIIAIIEEWESPDLALEDVWAWRRRPSAGSEASTKIDWLKTIQRVFSGDTTTGKLPISAPGASG